MIKLATLAAGLNSERQNIESQNVEGWKRCALSFYNRQNAFIRRSMLDVRCSTFISLDLTLAARDGADR